MVSQYFNRLISLTYFILNKFTYKNLNFRAVIKLSTRVQGKKFISVGENSIIQRGGWLLALKHKDETPNLHIGDNCSIGDYSHIVAVKNVTIESDVLIANNVYISDNAHDYSRIDIAVQNQEIIFKGEVILKTGCWIGENVCIIGASVGKNSVIGANSVVTKDIDDYCIAVGSPAKVIKRYSFDQSEWVSIK